MEVLLCELVRILSHVFLLSITKITPSFVDRDTYMQFCGGGVGHIPTPVVEPEPIPELDEEEVDLMMIIAGKTESGQGQLTAEDEQEPPDNHSGSEEDPDDVEDPDDDSDSVNGDGDIDDTDELDEGQLSQRLREVIIDEMGFSDL